MNAGSWGGEIKDCLQEISVLDEEGEVRRWESSRISFGYRTLLTPKRSTILSGAFCLERSNPGQVQDMVTSNLARKRATQPLRQPSAGSIFKNPAGMAAGKLIEMAGLKGMRCGGALVSRKHANFIVNTGGATASDILSLLGLVRDQVQARFGVKLEPEVEIIGA
jgi:UDP-N-acetylmuramate dehydrogenase